MATNDSSDSSNYGGQEPGQTLSETGPIDPDAIFEVRVPIHRPVKPIVDDDTNDVIGYVYSSGGYSEFYDLNGQLVAVDEIPLETPLFDPIDLIFLGGGLIRGIFKGGAAVLGKQAAKASAKVAIGAGTRLAIRGLTAGIVGLMRASLRKIISARTLKFTATTAARMASKDRHVPVQILHLAIKHGARAADPKKVAGLFQYTTQMSRNGVDYTLKVVVRESDWTIMHFHYFR